MNFEREKNYGNSHNGKKSCSCIRNKFYQVVFLTRTSSVVCGQPRIVFLCDISLFLQYSHQVSSTSSCNVQFFVQNSSTFRLENQAWPISFWVDIPSEQKLKDAGILDIFPFKHYKSSTSLQTGKLFKSFLRQSKKKKTY